MCAMKAYSNASYAVRYHAILVSTPNLHRNFANWPRHATPESPEREVFLHTLTFGKYVAIEKTHHQGRGKQNLALREMSPGALARTTSVRNPRTFETLCREFWRRPSIVCRCESAVAFCRICQKPPDPKLVNGVLIIQAGAPRLKIHMRNRCRRHNDFSSGYDPFLNFHVRPIWHSDDIEVHSEAQSLGIDSLEHWQTSQVVDIKAYAITVTLNRTGINFGSYSGEQLRISVYLKYCPRRGCDRVSCSVREVSLPEVFKM